MNLNLWSIGWHMLSIFFLTLLFKRYLFRPLRAYMNKNAEEMVHERKQLDVVKQEITVQQKQVSEAKEQIQAKSAETLTRSQQQAEALAADVLKNAEAEAERIRVRAEQEAEQIRIKSIEQTEERIGALSVQLAERILAREIKREDHDAMIAAFIKEVAK